MPSIKREKNIRNFFSKNLENYNFATAAVKKKWAKFIIIPFLHENNISFWYMYVFFPLIFQ